MTISMQSIMFINENEKLISGCYKLLILKFYNFFLPSRQYFMIFFSPDMLSIIFKIFYIFILI